MSSVSVAAIGPVTAPTAQGARSAVCEISGIPEGFPTKLDSELAWVGADIKFPDYVYHLTETDIAELEKAYDNFMKLELDGDNVDGSNFVLPTLGPKLRGMSKEIYAGLGFVLIRGLDVKKYQVEQLTIMYMGMQSHIASERGRQDVVGNILVHIIPDKSTEMRAAHHRHSTDAIGFHNEEACDVVGWLTRNTAVSGGKCVISSAYQVYNELAAARPDIIRTLAKGDWPFSMPHFKCRPIIFYEDGNLITNFGRAPLVGSAAHPRPKRYPIVNKSQLEALDAIQAIAYNNKYEIQTQPGDIHFINNLAVFHSREGFVDGMSQKRHLVRTWNRDTENGWKIPEALAREYIDAYDPEAPIVCQPEPIPDADFPLRSQPN
ncbi:TfdA family Taurine catabolism dioxygenase TauD [Zalerion maritima]|uniref:TfdA family Taurine catabolism dioxygenase TauD n=1 Tax=Zalerion maritima TaxID=339359 RepID=A0AAD5RFW3_9PEZI|nr:TfdA family Taurine catabolism dioxygenase TauD [Zalerion maritima]